MSGRGDGRALNGVTIEGGGDHMGVGTSRTPWEFFIILSLLLGAEVVTEVA